MKSLGIKICIATCLAFVSSSLYATTTLRFSVTGTARATGFSDNLGVAGVDGMRWGIVIDTQGNGFQGGAYDLFDSSISGFLGASSSATDDYFFIPGTPPTTSTLAGTGSDPGGSGGITSMVGAPNGTDGLIAGVTTGDPFAIIWFATTPNADGTYYGLMTDASFLLPASGSFVDFVAPFTGSSADPIKPASYQFASVPEPSRSVLALLGLGLVLLRRRRA